MSTDAFEQLIDVAAPGGGSYPVQRGHRRGVRSPHTFDAARWPPSSLTSPYAPQGSTTAVLTGRATSSALLGGVRRGGWPGADRPSAGAARAGPDVEQGLELAEYGVERQAGAGTFGSRRSWVQKACARAASVTWRCQPR